MKDLARHPGLAAIHGSMVFLMDWRPSLVARFGQLQTAVDGFCTVGSNPSVSATKRWNCPRLESFAPHPYVESNLAAAM